ncbi:MAG: ABC transporter permease [Comamonadaceae bacterium]|nr:MAG: ABC transporter permease [Comamonadaceae bacterium]
MNPHAAHPTSFRSLVNSLWSHRQLIAQMTRREVVGRYKGSVMGLLWSFLNPVLMLVIYTFVFSVVFQARWGDGRETKAQFAVILFAGMIVHALFADILNRAPTLILANSNYVKKVVFPLETLVAVAAGSALFHAMASLTVLVLAMVVLQGQLTWTVVFVPVVLAPMLILALALGWLFASLGVFLRDVGQVVGVLTTVLLFLSPVFFPVSAIPEFLQPWMRANPLTFIIEQTRAVLIFGQLPDWVGLTRYLAVALIAAWLGYAWFQKTRKGFADVL